MSMEYLRVMPPPETLLSQSWRRYVNAFWDSGTSHFTLNAFTADGTPPTAAMWQYAQCFHAVFTYWKHTNSADALTKLQGLWNWVVANWTPAQMILVGAGTTHPAQDDATWGSSLFLEAYLALGDPNALTYLKGLLDATYTRFYDTTTGGGLWYSDARTAKSSYQAPYAVICYKYYLITGDQTYRSRALSLLAWANSVLANVPAQFAGLYWCQVDPTGTGIGTPTAGNISLNGSWTFLCGNMAYAALNVLFYNDIGDPSYLAQAQATAAAILAYEMSSPFVLKNDRDGFTNAWGFPDYAQYVAPNAPAGVSYQHLSGTAVSAATVAVNYDGTFGSDWQAPPIGVKSGNGAVSQMLIVSSQSMTIIASGL